MREQMAFKGHFEVLKNGIVIFDHSNLILDVGLDIIADRLYYNNNLVYQIGIYTDTTSPVATDTTFPTGELATATATVTRVAGSSAIMASSTFAAGVGTGTIAQLAVIAPITATPEQLAVRPISRALVSPAIVKDSASELIIRWTLTVARS